MTVYFYIPNKAINEATIYYTKIVEQAFLENNVSVIRKESLDFSLKKEDLIFTIRIIDFIKARVKLRTKRIAIWFQGILGEEYLLLNNNSLKAKVVKKIVDICEKYTLKNSFFSFFVSDAMRRYFEKKHNLLLDEDYALVPCYNKKLNKAYFDTGKENYTFVYAGTLFSWQCFETTVKLFKEIEKLNEKAKFIVLTKEKNEAKDILNKYDVRNYEISFVSLDQLDLELSKYKYGFLLREDDVINNVATPTKMNSYLSVGLIPIYTNVVYDFEEKLDLGSYSIKIDINADLSLSAEQIFLKDQVTVDYSEYYGICEKNFTHYYDDSYNVDLIKNTLVRKALV
ncbi:MULTISPECIES: hypothetical protein [Myroides]|uniref:Uncharacterized protein n=1 Tax=Myroides albus TaxID=2562892 RepID=A0A6I3LAW4_9FLAO|nr:MULTISPECIES: hypothetical protein [Myroides]MTG96569.1 hypothetical protein [Myroides albus]MVX34565.1 hypothetical protein [Myroides sp. LoEW2-1]UVD81017.1 hypothetical protein NWE55_07155 [Myroides albus]